MAGDVAWLSCSHNDREGGRLLVHLLDAIRTAVPGAADVLSDQLGVATERVDVGLAIDRLESELKRLLVEPLVIVVDDAEHLTGSTEAQRIVADLLAMPLERSRVAIASRRALGLKTARVRVAGRLTELGPAELAFGVEECAELMLRRTGREPSRDEAEAVWTATEGWPLGVALAAGSDQPAMARPARADGLNAYLEEELLDPLEPRLRDAIIDSSVAPELHPALVRALGLPEDLLEEIRRRGIPLRAPDVANGRLAFHPLVRDLLAARLVRDRPQERRARLHAVVGAALEADGRGPKPSSTGWRPAATTERESWWLATAGRCWRPHPERSGAGSNACPGTLAPCPGCGCSKASSLPERGAWRMPRRR